MLGFLGFFVSFCVGNNEEIGGDSLMIVGIGYEKVPAQWYHLRIISVTQNESNSGMDIGWISQFEL